jgi:uncharacterized membrane protein
MAKKPIQKKAKAVEKDNSDSKLFAFLGIFLTVIGYIIVMLARKEDKYAMYYAKQGLVLFIVCIIIGIAGAIVGWIPLIGSIIKLVLNAVTFALWIVGIIYSLSGEEKEVPIIGVFAKKI